MVRINEFGEIVRDDPPANRPRPPAPSPPPTRNADGPGRVLRMMIVGTVVLGLLGAAAGYGAGARWFRTDLPESGKWYRGVGSFWHAVHIASWSRHPVHHAIQDATMPLRVLLV